MIRFIILFFVGMLISWAGTLPLSMLNLKATEISINKGLTDALWFGLGVTLVEVIYAWFTVAAIERLKRKKKLINLLSKVGAAVMFLLAIVYFYLCFFPSGASETSRFSKLHIPAFVLGLFLSAINPVQLFFWMGWNLTLQQKGILKSGTVNHIVFVTGIGCGTFVALALFAVLGLQLKTWLLAHQLLLNASIGLLFVWAGVVLLRKRNQTV